MKKFLKFVRIIFLIFLAYMAVGYSFRIYQAYQFAKIREKRAKCQSVLHKGWKHHQIAKFEDMKNQALTISNSETDCVYVYITNIVDGSSPQTPYAFCPPENHRDEMANVLFVDGSVMAMKFAEFKGFIEERKLTNYWQSKAMNK